VAVYGFKHPHFTLHTYMIDTSDIYAYTVAAKGFKFVMFSEFNTTAASLITRIYIYLHIDHRIYTYIARLHIYATFTQVQMQTYTQIQI